ncbi:MAG TPA: hypothetical protein VH589_19040 [Trebonia sp.]|jgi:predicted DNA-binding ribbon-helix-helix protein
MDFWWNTLTAQCQATKVQAAELLAQTAELLERSAVLEHRVRDTLQQISQDRALRSGMLIREAD